MRTFIDTYRRALPSPAAIGPFRFELRFETRFRAGRSLAFPCDEKGCVPRDDLSDQAWRHCLWARAVVGREFVAQAVRAATDGDARD